MKKWTDIDTLERHGWDGEAWVAYLPCGTGGGCDLVMGFGHTRGAALTAARAGGIEQGAPENMEYEAIEVGSGGE